MPGGRPTCTNPRTRQVTPSLMRAAFLRKVTAAPGINGRPPLRWDVRAAPLPHLRKPLSFGRRRIQRRLA